MQVEELPPVDEIFINGRRYRVPERVIILDFWSKLKPGINKLYVPILPYMVIMSILLWSVGTVLEDHLLL